MSQEHTKHPSPVAGTSRSPGHWRQALAMALATGLLLAGCGDGKDSGSSAQTAPPAPEPTPQEKIVQLEASGQLPQLERLPLLGGIDADDDGVRDDIALHIEKSYTDPVQRRAAMQVARAYQHQLLVSKQDHVALQEASEQMMRAIACVNRYAFPGDGGERQSLRLMDELEAMTTNTKERLQAYLAYNKARSGSVSVRAEGEVCD